MYCLVVPFVPLAQGIESINGLTNWIESRARRFRNGFDQIRVITRSSARSWRATVLYTLQNVIQHLPAWFVGDPERFSAFTFLAPPVTSLKYQTFGFNVDFHWHFIACWLWLPVPLSVPHMLPLRLKWTRNNGMGCAQRGVLTFKR